MTSFLLDMAVKGTLILIATNVLVVTMRRSSAAARHLTWAVGLSSVVALPLLGRLLPDWSLDILPETAPQAAGAAEPVPGLFGGWMEWLVLVWAAGAGLVLGALLAARLHVWWLSRRAEPLGRGPWPALLTALAGEIDLSRPVAVRRIDRPIMPMVWGVLRPVVLLPADADRWPTPLRRDVLLHELAHVKRCDEIAQILGRLACALHWFNPLVWVASRRLRVERERACDDHVLELGTSPCDYAEHLVAIARGRSPARSYALALGMAGPSAFGERLSALLDPRRPRSVLSARLALRAAMGAALMVLPLAAVQPERAASRELALAPAAVAPDDGPWIPTPPPSVSAGIRPAEPGSRERPALTPAPTPAPVRKRAVRSPSESPLRSKHGAVLTPVVSMAPIDVRLSRPTPVLRRRLVVDHTETCEAEADDRQESVWPVQLVARSASTTP